MTVRDGDRWRQAKRNGSGVQLSLELYVPTPPKSRQTTEAFAQARQNIMEKVTPTIDELRQIVESMKGLVKIYHDV